MPTFDILRTQLTDLRDQIASLLTEEIGTLSNGQAAIWIGRIPSTLKTTGLQCEIQEAKEGDAIPIANHQTYAKQHWRVVLTNFADDHKLKVAKIKMQSGFVQVMAPRYVQATDLTLERCTFFLFAPEIQSR